MDETIDRYRNQLVDRLRDVSEQQMGYTGYSIRFTMWNSIWYRLDDRITQDVLIPIVDNIKETK